MAMTKVARTIERGTLMFGTANTYATVAAFAGIRVKDEREQDRNHLIEVRFECPLTPELAEDIEPALVRDLFVDGEPKAELTQVVLALAPGTQVMTVRHHPDLDPIAKTQGVQIRKIRAAKSEAGTWMLGWTVMFQFDQDMVIGLIKALKQGVYLTYELQEPPLNFDAPADAAGDDPGPGPTNVALFDPEDGQRYPKRGRRKKGHPADAANAAADGDDAPAVQ